MAGVLCLVVLFATLCPATGYAAETEPKRIRVGYFAFPGYHEVYQDDNGTHGRGYGFDFLQLLRRYTPLDSNFDTKLESGFLFQLAKQAPKTLCKASFLQFGREPYPLLQNAT